MLTLIEGYSAFPPAESGMMSVFTSESVSHAMMTEIPICCTVDPLHFHPSTSEIYRAFFVARNGRILGMIPLEAATDEEARMMACGLADEDEDEIVELWAGLRTVARFQRIGGTVGTF
ncbi:hypothetical protein [Methylobacterium oxalidis]|uniref:hypothetical protein n=1 Tax=Methylobacterium oxalidis TaxID=944322 RepID=UPI0033147714